MTKRDSSKFVTTKENFKVPLPLKSSISSIFINKGEGRIIQILITDSLSPCFRNNIKVNISTGTRQKYIFNLNISKITIFALLSLYANNMSTFGASLVAQLVKNPPATWEIWVQSLG